MIDTERYEMQSIEHWINTVTLDPMDSLFPDFMHHYTILTIWNYSERFVQSIHIASLEHNLYTGQYRLDRPAIE